MCIYEKRGRLVQPITDFALFSFFYSGLARRKSAFSLIWLSVMATAVVSFQWFFWGYSLAFSHSAGKYIGDLENIGFRNVLAAPSVGSPKIPDLLFAVYQGMFAAITVALAIGAVAERGTFDARGAHQSLSNLSKTLTPIRPYAPRRCLHVYLDHYYLRSDCLLDLEPVRMGGQDGRTRFRWWNSCPHLLWLCCPRLLPGVRKTPRSRYPGVELSSPQCYTHRYRNGFPLGRLVWLQRWFRSCSQHACCHGSRGH